MLQAESLTERIQTLIAEALQIPPETTSPDLTFGDLPQWDSMGHMEVMLLLEERFGVEINADTIAALTSVPLICAYLQENGHA
ncbi:MAG: acyl carrier protein [Chloroflexi bacterium]|nr:acyl carrier protein [Chloroflexota bacterium]